MVNLLVANNDLNFFKQIVNEVIKDNVRVCKLSTDEEETLNILRNLKNKDWYKESIFVIVEDTSLLSLLDDNNLIFDYTIKGTGVQEIAIRLNRLIKKKDIKIKRKQISVELEKLGYDFHYNGTNYLQDVILQMYLHDEFSVNSLQRDIYPIVSNTYNKSVHNIKCNINNATELMYCKCEQSKLKNYFNFYDDTKPTTKIVVYTVLNKIKL